MSEPWDANLAVYCRTCRFATDIGQNLVTGQRIFSHPSSVLEHHRRLGIAEHPADPVKIEEIEDPIVLCDFDSAIPAVVVYATAETYVEHLRTVVSESRSAGEYHRRHNAARVRKTKTASAGGHDNGSRWTACAECAELIEARDLLGLVRRVVDSLPRRNTNTAKKMLAARGVLMTQYEEFFADLRPGRGRLEPGHPYGVWES